MGDAAANHDAYNTWMSTYGFTQTKELTITGLGAESREYNGKTDVIITGPPVLNRVVPSDSVTIDDSTIPTTGTMADADVGTDKPVDITSLKLEGADSNKYSLNTQPKITVSIEKIAAPIKEFKEPDKTGWDQEVTFSVQMDKRGGVAFPTGTVTFKEDNVILEKDVAIDGDGKATWTGTLSAKKFAAMRKITAEYTAADTELNYKASTTQGVEYTPDKADQAVLSITNTDKYTYIPDGIELTTDGGSGDGAVKFDIVKKDSTGEGEIIDGNKLMVEKCGTFKLAATKAEDGNYNAVTSAPKEFEISQGTLKELTFKSKTVDYNNLNQSLSVEGTIPAGCQVSYVPEKVKDAGSHKITATISGEGYKTETLEATLTIKAATPVINLTAQEGKVKVGETITLTAQITGITGAITILKAGVASIQVSLPETEVYNATQTNVTVTIAKADITGITYNDQTLTADGADHSLLLTGTLPEGATVAYENNTHKDPGTYQAKAFINGGTNYNSQTLAATLIIEKAIVPIPIPKIASEIEAAIDKVPSAEDYKKQTDEEKADVKRHVEAIVTRTTALDKAEQAKINPESLKKLSDLYESIYALNVKKIVTIEAGVKAPIAIDTVNIYGAAMAAGIIDTNSDIQVNIKQEKDQDGAAIALAMELYVKKAGESEATKVELKTPIVFSLDLANTIKTEGLTVKHLNADNSLKETLTPVMEGRNATVTTTSFSNFLFVETAKPVDPEKPTDPEKPVDPSITTNDSTAQNTFINPITGQPMDTTTTAMTGVVLLSVLGLAGLAGWQKMKKTK